MKADKAKVARLLKTARGQIDGVLKMIDGDQYCIDIANQIMAAEAVQIRRLSGRIWSVAFWRRPSRATRRNGVKNWMKLRLFWISLPARPLLKGGALLYVLYRRAPFFMPKSVRCNRSAQEKRKIRADGLRVAASSGINTGKMANQ